MTEVAEARSLLKRGAGQARRASQALAEAARVMDAVEKATVIHQETVVGGQAPAGLAAKVAAASQEHGAVDVLVIANIRAPEAGRRS